MWRENETGAKKKPKITQNTKIKYQNTESHFNRPFWGCFGPAPTPIFNFSKIMITSSDWANFFTNRQLSWLYSETASSDFCEWENFLENKGTENLGNMVFYFGILCDFAKKSGSFLRPSHAQHRSFRTLFDPIPSLFEPIMQAKSQREQETKSMTGKNER